MVRAISSKQSALETDEGHRSGSTHGTSQHTAAVCTQAGGDIRSQYRHPCGIDGLDRLSHQPRHRAIQSGAQQGVDNHRMAIDALTVIHDHRHPSILGLGPGAVGVAL